MSEKVFNCICKKSFSYLNNLYRHQAKCEMSFNLDTPGSKRKRTMTVNDRVANAINSSIENDLDEKGIKGLLDTNEDLTLELLKKGITEQKRCLKKMSIKKK